MTVLLMARQVCGTGRRVAIVLAFESRGLNTWTSKNYEH